MQIGGIKTELVVFEYLLLDVLSIDHRDSSHNPYLMGAGILKAFEDGLDNKMDPGEPEKKIFMMQ